jgi:hypothetical protein
MHHILNDQLIQKTVTKTKEKNLLKVILKTLQFNL